MRFRREVHDVRDFMLLNDPKCFGLVTQIHLLKNIFRMFGNFFQIRQMPCISEAIQVDQLRHFRTINDMMDQI